MHLARPALPPQSRLLCITGSGHSQTGADRQLELQNQNTATSCSSRPTDRYFRATVHFCSVQQPVTRPGSPCPPLHYVDDYGSGFTGFEDLRGALGYNRNSASTSDRGHIRVKPCPKGVREMSLEVEQRIKDNNLPPDLARRMGQM